MPLILKKHGKINKKRLTLALKTLRQQLEEVQDAISVVMTGQSYDMNGRSLTRADLGALNDREEILLKRLSSSGLDDIVGSTSTTGSYEVTFSA